MKKTLCLFLSLLFLLPTFAGCNDGSLSSLPENSPSFSPSIGQDGGESAPSSPSFAPLPSEGGEADPSFSELPLPIDEICFYAPRFGPDAENISFDHAKIFNRGGTPSVEIREGTVTVAFCVALNVYDLDYLTHLSSWLKEHTRVLNALAQKTFQELTDPEQYNYKDFYDEEGKPIPEKFETEMQRLDYGINFTARFHEIGEDAMKQEVKELWLERCKKANIPAVDVGKDYLYIICTLPELCAMADEREKGLGLYYILSASKEQYVADRKNMVK